MYEVITMKPTHIINICSLKHNKTFKKINKMESSVDIDILSWQGQ